jgi:hypothetical protein
MSMQTKDLPNTSSRYIRTGVALAIFVCLYTLGCTPWHLTDSASDTSATQKISLPYVQGDDDGKLSSCLVEAINNQVGFRVDDSGRYQLCVRLLSSKDYKLGFRYNPKELKKGNKDLILEETRALSLAQVSLIDRFTNATIAGPEYILGSNDYDHQENCIDNDINRFSLGQLSDIDTSVDVVNIPLYKDLAGKIGLWLSGAYKKTPETKA